RKIFLPFSLILLVFLSGCTLPWDQHTLPTYKDDAITIENYAVSSTEPYAGGSVTIQFLVQNNIEDEIENVEVNFFDLSVFSLQKLDCGQDGIKGEKNCSFKLDSLDYHPIKIALEAPSEEVITAPTRFTISFYVKYNMSSKRSVMIPVIDGIIKTEPESSFLVSEQKHGPVRVDFDFPIKRVRREDSREIVERWVVAGEPFETKITFKHTGTLRDVQPINISNNTIKIEVKELNRTSICDFGVNNFSLKNIVLLSTSERNLLKCNFNATKTGYPEYLAELSIEYNYTYSFIKRETFTVKPSIF
ncbi:MAG: hypothetical protein QW140_02435, partial [Candidatus Aenigmatarchaeota archaeon]